MWGVIEADPDAVTHNSVGDLKDVMKSAFNQTRSAVSMGQALPFGTTPRRS